MLRFQEQLHFCKEKYIVTSDVSKAVEAPSHLPYPYLEHRCYPSEPVLSIPRSGAISQTIAGRTLGLRLIEVGIGHAPVETLRIPLGQAKRAGGTATDAKPENTKGRVCSSLRPSTGSRYDAIAHNPIAMASNQNAALQKPRRQRPSKGRGLRTQTGW